MDLWRSPAVDVLGAVCSVLTRVAVTVCTVFYFMLRGESPKLLPAGNSSSGSDMSSGSSENVTKTSSSTDNTQFITRSYSRWSPYDEGVTLSWRDVSVSAHTGTGAKKKCKRIINSVTGAVKAGSLVALMGASGAGKSTLMSALGYRQTGNVLVEGDILVNGRPVGEFMHELSGYLHQEDLFVGSLTVMEHMMIMAKLKMSRKLSNFDRKSKIYDILTQFGLIHCTNTRIGLMGAQKTLSGGEKKRLAFATELLTDPPLLFCDEPTTGLDSYSAQKLVRSMNLMAANGKTILCTIHQPSSELFAMFSQILLLADGRIAFMGSTQYGLEFFKRLGYKCPMNYNPADFFIRTLAMTPNFEESSRQTIKTVCDNFAVSEASKETNVVVQYEFHMGRTSQYSQYRDDNKLKRPFWWTRLYVLIYRSLLECVRDPTIQGFRILQKIAIAVMVGLCYLGTDALTQNGIQSVQGAVFILTAENTFSPMYSVLNLFPQEFPLFHREYKAGLYSIWVYYIAKILAILPGILFEPFIFGLITYLMSGLRLTVYAIGMTLFIVILTMNVSIACGCFFSTAFNSVPTAMSYLVPFDVMLMITQGVFIKLSSLPVGIALLQYISWLMYSTESMMILQWEDVQNITCEITNPSIPCVNTGAEVLNKLSFSTDNFFRDIINMIVLYLIFHVLAFIFLWRRAKTR